MVDVREEDVVVEDVVGSGFEPRSLTKKAYELLIPTVKSVCPFYSVGPPKDCCRWWSSPVRKYSRLPELWVMTNQMICLRLWSLEIWCMMS